MNCLNCNFESNDVEEFKNHIKYYHFLTYSEYFENITLTNIDDYSCCFKCNNIKYPLTWIDQDFYYLPCRDCLKTPTDKQDAKRDIIKNIKNFYKKIIGDRHFLLFVLDDIYYSSTLPHNYSTFNKTLKSLNLPKNRDDFWFIDWLPGFPRIINEENIKGIRIVNLTDYFKRNVEYKENNDIIVKNYIIHYPEIVPYDAKHFFRHNILNINGTRKTKRLRLESDKCIKFFNTDRNDWKSIFKICNKSDDTEVDFNTISPQDLLTIKMAIFRSKPCIKLVLEIIYEMVRKIRTFRDGIFLKNTILVDPDSKMDFNLSWIPEENKQELINISIL